MSEFTGKCDLYDHIMMEKMYPKYPDNENSPLISDELECFKIFKEKTKGVIYQHQKIELSDCNIDAEIRNVDNPSILSKIPHEETIVAKRFKAPTRTKITYTYIYFGTEYSSLKQLNKHGYHTTVPIVFNSLFDIIPYYPYCIAYWTCDKGKELVVLSSKSEFEKNTTKCLTYGHSLDYVNTSRQKLQKHYLEVIEKYKDEILKEEKVNE